MIDVVEEHETKQGKIILKEGSQNIGNLGPGTTCPCVEPQSSKSACDCNLCRRYHKLFKNSAILSPNSVISESIESTKQKTNYPSPRAQKVSGKCPCCIEKLEEIPNRTRNSKMPCRNNSDWTNFTDDNGGSALDHLRSYSTKEEEFRNMFKADLESHYKKLYERVSRRSNRRES
ncbi:hypothetical protein J6590_017012 [Homalodisca vitripennis]|nr:hypothetical protein J6590_017012 [Homalodisca vitripennis]